MNHKKNIMNPMLKKGWSLLLAIVMLVSVNAQKTVAPKPVALKKVTKENLPVIKKEVTIKGKKGKTTNQTLYYVEDYYKKFDDGIYAEITTDSGKIIIKLHHDKAPLTVMNFVGLSEGTLPNTFRGKGEPYYDNLKFHRVISQFNGDGQDFMAQGGDPTGTGSGGPGYDFPDEFHPELRHSGPGVLSMANSGPNTNGSQFFITTTATGWLDDKHSIFGMVVEGQNIVNHLKTNDVMKSIRIIRKGNTAIEFTADSVSFEKIKKDKLAQALIERKKRDFAIDSAMVLARYPNAKQTASGLWYDMTKVGEGNNAQSGDKVSMYYELSNPSGKVIESNFGKNPFTFKLGANEVIAAWDEGIALMNTGAECTLIVPSALGYGEQGAGADIPGNTSLIFKTKLESIKKSASTDFALNDAEVLGMFPTAQKTASGLWYIETKKGTGANAKVGQRVKMQYTLKLSDGEVLESNMQDEAFAFTLGANEVIAGWDEGIALMNPGAEYTLIIPSKLAYGQRGSGRKIGPNTSLIFETRLVEIAAPLASDFAEDDAVMKKEFPDAVKTSSGLWYIMRNPGTDPKPTPGQTVSVLYRGTFGDGREFDKNINHEKPFEFPLGQGRVIKGWDEGIALLGKGGFARFIIPSKLAYGKTGFASVIGPNTTLIFDVQLLGAK